MNTVKKIAKNSIYLFGADVINKISLLLIAIFIARFLGDAEFGRYSFAIAFSFFFFILGNFGLNNLIIRDVSKKRDEVKKYVDNVLSLRLIFSVISFFLLIIIINLMNYPSSVKLIVYLFGLYSILDTVSEMFKAVFYAFEEIKYIAITRIINKSLILIFSLLALFFGYGLLYVAYIFVISILIDILLSFLIVQKKFTKVSFGRDTAFWKFLLRKAWPFLLLNFFTIIYFKIDIVMLSKISGDSVVGWYNAAYQLIEGIMMIPIIFMSVVFPVMSRLSAQSKESLIISCQKSLKYLIIIALPIAVGTFLLSGRFIYWFYGPEFVNAGSSLNIIVLSIIFIFAVRPLSYSLIVIEKQRLNLFFVIIASIINIILNLILIPKYAGNGAAISTLICEIILFALIYCFFIKYFRKINILRIFFKPFIAAIAMGIFTFFFFKLNLVLLVGFSAIVYTLFILIFKTFKKDDVSLFRELIKNDQP